MKYFLAAMVLTCLYGGTQEGKDLLRKYTRLYNENAEYLTRLECLANKAFNRALTMKDKGSKTSKIVDKSSK